MSIFGGNPAVKAGNHAYRCHVDGNKLLEAGKTEEARAKHDEALKYYAEAYEAGGHADVLRRAADAPGRV